MLRKFATICVLFGTVFVITNTGEVPSAPVAASNLSPAPIEAPPLVDPKPSEPAPIQVAEVSLPAAPPTEAEQMLAADSRLRALKNKSPRKLDPRLTEAAQDQADYLARTGQFDHYVNGNPRIRARKFGFPATDSIRSVTENLTAITETVEGAFSAWQKSSGHYENILDDGYDLAGFAVAKEGRLAPVWVAVYGTESPTLAATPGNTTLYTQPQYTEPQGRWVTSDQPIYGPFGRQRGTQRVTRWQGPPMQAPQQKPMQFESFGACGPGGCGVGIFRGRR